MLGSEILGLDGSLQNEGTILGTMMSEHSGMLKQNHWAQSFKLSLKSNVLELVE